MVDHGLDPDYDANCFRAVFHIGNLRDDLSLTAKFETFMEKMGIQILYSNHPSLLVEEAAHQQTSNAPIGALTAQGLQDLQSSFVDQAARFQIPSYHGPESSPEAGDAESEPADNQRPALRRNKTEAPAARLHEWHRSASQVSKRTGRAMSEDGTLARLSPRKQGGKAAGQTDTASPVAQTTRRNSVENTPKWNTSNLTAEFAAVLAHRRAKGIPAGGRRRTRPSLTESLADTLTSSQGEAVERTKDLVARQGQAAYRWMGPEDAALGPLSTHLPVNSPQTVAAPTATTLQEQDRRATEHYATRLSRNSIYRWFVSLQDLLDREEESERLAAAHHQERVLVRSLDTWRNDFFDRVVFLSNGADLLILKKWQQKWHSRWYLIHHQNRLPKWFFRGVFKGWRAKTQLRLHEKDAEVPDIHSKHLARSALRSWRAALLTVQTQQALAAQFNFGVMRDRLDRIHDEWYQQAMRPMQIAQHYTQNLARDAIRQWRLAAGAATFARNRSGLRVRAALKTWRLQTRALWLTRQQATRKAVPTSSKTSAHVALQLQPDRVTSLQTVTLQHLTLRAWTAAHHTQQRNAQLAAYFREPVIHAFCLSAWRARTGALQQFPAWAHDAQFFFTTTAALRTWRAQAAAARRERRRAAFGEMRRRVRSAAVRRCVERWREQNRWVVDAPGLVQEQVESVSGRAVVRFLSAWRARCAEVHTFDDEAGLISRGLAKTKGLRLWAERWRGVREMEAEGRSRDGAAVVQSTAVFLHRWSMLTLGVRALRLQAELLAERNRRGRIRSMISHWGKRARERRGAFGDGEEEGAEDTFVGVPRLGLVPPVEQSPFVPGRQVTPLRPLVPAGAVPVQSALPGYLGTPSKRATRARGLLGSGYTPARISKY